MNIKVAIVDDHPLIISGVQNMLRYHADIDVTGAYLTGKDLLEGLSQKCPDVLLLDIQMPGQQGDELARVITRRYPGIAILALTNLDSPYYIKSMLQHDGVLGYVLKTSGEESLVNAIRTVASGQKYLEPVIRERARQATNPKKMDGNNPVLTRREKEILQLLAQDHSSQDIANQLFIGKRTVDNHRISLLLKLGVKNSASLVKKAIDLGLIK